MVVEQKQVTAVIHACAGMLVYNGFARLVALSVQRWREYAKCDFQFLRLLGHCGKLLCMDARRGYNNIEAVHLLGCAVNLKSGVVAVPHQILELYGTALGNTDIE